MIGEYDRHAFGLYQSQVFSCSLLDYSSTATMIPASNMPFSLCSKSLTSETNLFDTSHTLPKILIPFLQVVILNLHKETGTQTKNLEKITQI